MMVADRGLQEIVLADLDRLLSNLHGNLSSAETVLIRIAGKLSLTTETPLQVCRNLHDGSLSHREFSVNGQADS
jgi:hypothetical protein